MGAVSDEYRERFQQDVATFEKPSTLADYLPEILLDFIIREKLIIPKTKIPKYKLIYLPLYYYINYVYYFSICCRYYKYKFM